MPISSADIYEPFKLFRKAANDLSKDWDLSPCLKITALPPPKGMCAALFLSVMPFDKRKTSVRPAPNESYSLNLQPPIAGPLTEL